MGNRRTMTQAASGSLIEYGLERFFRTDVPLRFQDEDLLRYPWLNDRDRYYYFERKLGGGGSAIAYKGWACDKDRVRIPNSPDLVLKLPNIDDGRSSSDIEIRTTTIHKKSIEEWAHVRKRLVGCRHANPIFDMGTVWVREPRPLLQLAVTAQQFLDNALPLKDWLVKRHIRPKIVKDSGGREIEDWGGISEWSDWLETASMLAKGLVEIHLRRVIHGDIWPPNIYISKTSPEYVVFIDFGESFISTPNGEPRIQPDHPYRAPERDKSEYVPTEQVDVYSFGKLLLYLTIGRDVTIPRTGRENNQPLAGYRRRAFIRDHLFDGKTGLVRKHPDILDIICQCTAWDPVDRPATIQILDRLEALQGKNDAAFSVPLANRLAELAGGAGAPELNPGNIFARFVDREVKEPGRLMERCRTDMVEVRGTRDVLIDSLVALFDDMAPGDSWTTLTTPSVWQHDGLGLDGRYSTATVEAVRRGAAVQRTFTVSIEELGLEWAEEFEKKLDRVQELAEVRRVFHVAIAEFHLHATTEEYKKRSDDFVLSRRERFLTVVESLDQMVNCWELAPKLFKKKPTTIRSTPGLYVGLIAVPTLGRVKELRTQNPVSLLFLDRHREERDKWLLVMTDIRGRNEYDNQAISWPQLRGIRVHKSVMGYPKDRVIGLEEVMRSSINLGCLLTPLAKLIREVPRTAAAAHA